ncbi:hypothetical protein HPB47_006124 [Ixodes persulcatus]|uniref:Uncharacterized protein n=1 Tax=Ixodes persulcatus TaxID=34615 RepID=A0AC60PBX7_IXOPE|nr:hypothetical protein HPB47_006124 [Ixodes persulcatus]
MVPPKKETSFAHSLGRTHAGLRRTRKAPQSIGSNERGTNVDIHWNPSRCPVPRASTHDALPLLSSVHRTGVLCTVSSYGESGDSFKAGAHKEDPLRFASRAACFGGRRTLRTHAPSPA